MGNGRPSGEKAGSPSPDVASGPLPGVPGASPAFHRMQKLVVATQESLVADFEAIDGGTFSTSTWPRAEGGGGRARTLRGPKLEKAAVNASAVFGPKNPLTGRPFRATGLSVIVHPRSPHAPTAHMNVRYFEEEGDGAPGGGWYGGGMDLTPMGFPYEEDTTHFLRVAEASVSEAGFDAAAFRRRADEYFFVKHRHRPRGVGGIFFDQVPAEGARDGYRLVESVARRFRDAYEPILRRRVDRPFTDEERAAQIRARGVYVEFNLLYDRGTRFGFESGGNPDAILASLPPLAGW